MLRKICLKFWRPKCSVESVPDTVFKHFKERVSRVIHMYIYTYKIELPASQVEQMERQAKEARDALIEKIQRDKEADERRREKAREKKERGGLNRALRLRHNPPSPCKSTSHLRSIHQMREMWLRNLISRQKHSPNKLRCPNPILQNSCLINHYKGAKGVTRVHHHWMWMHQKGFEEQQSREESGQAEEESDKPPPEGDFRRREGKDSNEGEDSSKPPPDPPDPPEPSDPDAPDPNPDEEGK